MRLPLDHILRQEVCTSSFIPYSSHVTRDTLKLHSGDYLQILRLQGAAHESADTRDLNRWHEQLNGFMRNIASPSVALWAHTRRRRCSDYPAGQFPAGFCHEFNQRYRNHMEGRRMLVNELYLSLIYRPQPVTGARFLDRFASQDAHLLAQRQQEELETVRELGSTALAALDRYEPELLGCYEHNGLLFSEPLEFLASLLNGESQRFALPRGDIRTLLASVRPFFGKGGLIALRGPARTRYSASLVIQEYPALTCPGMLDALLGMPFELILSQSFGFLSKPVAIGRMQRQQARMVNAGDVAISQIDEIDQALDDLSSNRFVLGTHSLGLMLTADEPRRLTEYISEAGAALSEAGMKWAREDSGAAGAYFAQLPGNFSLRPRVGDISSRNFAGLCSLHNHPTGRLHGNQWGEAVTMFRTTSGAPYYFSFHKPVPGQRPDPNHRDLANTVVIGKSGTGKTVLEMVLLAQAQKFHQPELGRPLCCVLFDKDLGACVGVRAMGGRYYPLRTGAPSGFNPFQLAPTAANLAFLELLVQQLVRHEQLPLTPSQEKEIHDAIQGVMAAAHDKRRLSSVLEFLDPTEVDGLQVRLARWCQGGALGWLFDNPQDTLQLDDTALLGFDVTEFLDHPQTRTPTIMYLFHRIESLLDGRRVIIFLDEFWKLLDDPAFEDLAQNKLVTIRKQDGLLVMFTQSPRQVLRSPIAYAIVGQTATKIFLPNPEADEDDYIGGFKLSRREFDIIRSLGEKSRRFLIRQGDNSVVAELDLRGFDDELAVLSGNAVSAGLAEQLIAQLGPDPQHWLPEFHRQRKGASA